MSETLTKSIGDRITYCRSSLGLTRKELSENWGGASVPTIARWELDTVKIPRKKLLSIIQFFYNNSIVVSENWIIDGSGTPPLLIRNEQFNEVEFDSLAQESLLNINMQQQGFIFGQVRNNLISPIIKYGDYVGGISLTNYMEANIINSYMDDLIFIKKNNGLVVGILKEVASGILVKNFSGASEIFSLEIVDAVGRIQWIIRRP